MQACILLFGCLLPPVDHRLGMPVSPPAKHYFAVFSWDSTPYEATNTHTFATVFRHCQGKVDQATLSWMPANMKVRATQLLAEAGRNLTLAESLEYASRNGLSVCVWGPYEVSEEFYSAFARHAKRFDDGEFLYRPCSRLSPRPNVLDCAHAVERFYRSEKSYIGPGGFGEKVSGRIAQELSPYYAGAKLPEPDALKLLDLKAYPLNGRDIVRAPVNAGVLKSAVPSPATVSR